MMVRRVPALSLLLCCLALAPLRAAESAPGNAPAGDELKDLRRMLEQQSRQLDVLAQEVARLNLLLQAKNNGGSPAPAEAGPASTPSPAADAPVQRAQAVHPESPAPAGAAASPVPGGLTHEVTKGETLTSIAKHYKVTVADLLKVNKIADVKRLQIGQTLALPPGAKPPQDTPTPTPEQN